MTENNIKNSIKRKVLADISFVTTVCNEERDITEFLGSLMEQTYLPGEIIIVDGGSKDRTFSKIAEFLKVEAPRDKNELGKAPEANDKENDIKTVIGNSRGGAGALNVRIIKKSGANISQGRNEAISNSSGRIICVSDAGCILDKNWMLEISRFYDDNSCNVVGGLNVPYCRNLLQKCLAVCIMPLKEEIKGERYMPSSRNISFRKKVWAGAGGYPENMDYGEDMKFDFNIKGTGYSIRFNPDAVVYWKMRENPAQISRQFFRYARGDADGRMYVYRHLARFTAFLILIVILLLAFYLSKLVLFALVPLFITYVFKSYKRLIRVFKSGGKCSFTGKEKFLSILIIPLLLLQIDLSKMCGYTYGLVKSIMKL